MEYRIGEAEDGVPLKTYLKKTLGISAAGLTELKKLPDGLMINGEHVTVRYLLRAGDLLSVSDEETENSDTVVPVKMPLSILFEDDDYIVLNKPPHMPTHPSHGHYEDTLANGIAFYFAGRGEPFVFRPCSRLDRDTSGVVTVAKTRTAAYRFQAAHTAGEVRKTYLAVLHGILPDEAGEIDAPIRRREDSVIARIVSDDGVPALTRYTVLAHGTAPDGETLTLVRAEPVTGRTHQLRVHFAYLGCPIVGDFLYGKEEPELIGRQALHCVKTSFPHPAAAWLEVTAPLPEDMRSLCGYFPSFDTETAKGEF